MLRSLVGSEMCIRDRYQRRVRGARIEVRMSAKDTKTPELSVLEEDDEFEEFEEDGLGPQGTGLARTESSMMVPKWQDNWDDEDMDDNFIDQLRTELKNTSNKMQCD
eukprot:TRINITY_DN1526_c0_g1_i2.p1 TRINITY_DN1526_c0_g1~~TRINITY_DN1526_c0_g1_i2.p1  ORF type:complete len:107 (+),score=53.37 TRINITY_DN1526_c0_g1_i2:157-477(+)